MIIADATLPLAAIFFPFFVQLVRCDNAFFTALTNSNMSNNPFAADMNESEQYSQRRDPPPVPKSKSGAPPRPPKDTAAPPSYEEVAGSDRKEYPREKREGSLRSRPSRSRREHRSHSDSHGDRRHRERRDSSSREHRSSRKSPSKKKVEPVKAKNLDTIDKLDVTAFFGGGFHHDGPFDACTPHRNKNVKSAPVMAFPPDGPNSSIAGMSNAAQEKQNQINLAFGTYNEDQNEIVGRKMQSKSRPVVATRTVDLSEPAATGPAYAPSANPSVVNFDSNTKADKVHGSTTAGLGSTTFIDGAPAPKATEQDTLAVPGSGLGRKKSLVQRLRKNSASENSSRRNSNDAPHSPVYSPVNSRRGSLNTAESHDNELIPPAGPGSSLLRRVKSLKVRRSKDTT